MAILSKHIGFMGGGEACELLLQNMLNNNIVESKNVYIYDPRGVRLDDMQKRFGINTVESNLGVIKSAEYIFSCVRSEYMPNLADEIKNADMTNRTIITVSSGVPMMLYESKLGGISVARILPNPPSRIGMGAIVVAFNNHCNQENKTDIMELLSPMGECYEISEDKINAATAVTCLAYGLGLFQAAVEASVLLGIDLNTSQKLVMQTMKGAIKVWEGKPEGLAEILDKSATPGGITAGMMYFLDKERFKYVVKGCIEDGTLRSKAFGDRVKEYITQVV